MFSIPMEVNSTIEAIMVIGIIMFVLGVVGLMILTTKLLVTKFFNNQVESTKEENNVYF